jgi:hypothetical protein
MNVHERHCSVRLDSDVSGSTLGSFLKRGFVRVRRKGLEMDGVRTHNHRVERDRPRGPRAKIRPSLERYRELPAG